MPVRYMILATKEHPLNPDNHVLVMQGAHKVAQWMRRETGQKWDWDGQVLQHQSNWARQAAWDDLSGFLDTCMSNMGLDRYKPGWLNMIVWQGGGGYAGGYTVVWKDGLFRRGQAVMGDWPLHNPFDLESREPEIPLTQPQCWGYHAHEGLHGMSGGVHAKPNTLRPDVMSWQYVEFPLCYMSEKTKAGALSTGLFLPAEEDDEPEDDVPLTRFEVLQTAAQEATELLTKALRYGEET